jgi:formylmethanofuran dehydrogenase subunit E
MPDYEYLKNKLAAKSERAKSERIEDVHPDMRVSCSSCGEKFRANKGNYINGKIHGYSHCEDHERRTPLI